MKTNKDYLDYLKYEDEIVKEFESNMEDLSRGDIFTAVIDYVFGISTTYDVDKFKVLSVVQCNHCSEYYETSEKLGLYCNDCINKFINK